MRQLCILIILLQLVLRERNEMDGPVGAEKNGWKACGRA